MAEMYVHGLPITEQIQGALIARMQAGPFKAMDLEEEAVRLGLPRCSEERAPVAMRTADRMIQRERKAGNIELKRPFWVWCGAKS